jgi:hypothetical protein
LVRTLTRTAYGNLLTFADSVRDSSFHLKSREVRDTQYLDKLITIVNALESLRINEMIDTFQEVIAELQVAISEMQHRGIRHQVQLRSSFPPEWHYYECLKYSRC